MKIYKKYNKFHNEKTIVDGIKFDSKKEANYYSNLLLLKKIGIIKNIQMQVEYILQDAFDKNGIHYRKISYIADFVAEYSDGRIEIIDVKGIKTDIYTLKKKLFEFKFPQLTIREI